MKYSFRPFKLDAASRVLLRDTEAVSLTAKVMDTLIALVEKHGKVVEKEQLLNTVWPNTVVEEANLTQNISTLRKVLGDNPRDHHFIATIAGRGYCFVAPVIESAAGAPPSTAEPMRPERGRPFRWLLAAALIGCIGAAAAWAVLESRERSHPDYAEPRVVPFTSYAGIEIMPAFSPDGNQIAYVRGNAGTAFMNVWKPLRGTSHIYVKLIGAASELQVTTGVGADSYPAWSPDGRYIAFAREAPGTSGYYVVPALGGPERRLSGLRGDRCAGLTWTPDGNALVTSEISEKSRAAPLVEIAVATGFSHALTSPPPDSYADISPAFSPDGKWLAFIRAGQSGVDVYTLGTKRGELRRITFDRRWKEDIAWTADSREVLFTGGEIGSTVDRLWRAPIQGGAIRPITTGDRSADMPALARRGNRLAYVAADANVSLWSLNLNGGSAAAPRLFIPSTRLQMDAQYSPDATKMAFLWGASGAFEIWVADSDGQHAAPVTHIGGGSPSWSPDGREIAFDSPRSGNPQIWRVRADGGPPTRITSQSGEDVVPGWSHDGQWIYFSSNRTGTFQIWKASRDGESASRPAIQVTKNGGFRPMESRDGKYLYFAKGRGVSGVWRIALTGGSAAREEPVLPSVPNWGWWALADRGIYFFENEGPATKLKFFDLAAATVRSITRVPGPIVAETGALTARFDGRGIVYAQMDSGNADIMLMENFR